MIHINTNYHNFFRKLWNRLYIPKRMSQFCIDLKNNLTAMAHFIFAFHVFIQKHILMRNSQFSLTIARLFELFVHSLLSLINTSHYNLWTRFLNLYFNFRTPLWHIGVIHYYKIWILNLYSKCVGWLLYHINKVIYIFVIIFTSLVINKYPIV
jgi:hypothetical protein